MHLADMAFEDKEWLGKLQDPTYIDEYQLSQIIEDDLPIDDTPEPPTTFGQLLYEFIKKPHGPETPNKLSRILWIISLGNRLVAYLKGGLKN